MPSHSLQAWSTHRAVALDEIENAHRSVGGAGPGRRYATQQINHAYAVLLAAQFQGFCRDLHSLAIDELVLAIQPTGLAAILREEWSFGRRLDRGNPSAANLAADFDRLGTVLWTQMELHDARNRQRRAMLDELCAWRNAIAHQDFRGTLFGGFMGLRLRKVQSWRAACDGLALSLDVVLRDHIGSHTGRFPW